jgi:hypothetical protein
MRRASAIVVALSLALTVMLAGCARAADSQLTAFLRAAAGAEEDRGWHYLFESTRERGYGDDKAAFIADAKAADWDAFEWTDAKVLWTDDSFAHVRVTVTSAPSTVPAFLLGHALLHGICLGDALEPDGLGAFVDTRPFGEGGLGGGGTTGSVARCNNQFIGQAGRTPSPGLVSG